MIGNTIKIDKEVDLPSDDLSIFFIGSHLLNQLIRKICFLLEVKLNAVAFVAYFA